MGVKGVEYWPENEALPKGYGAGMEASGVVGSSSE